MLVELVAVPVAPHPEVHQAGRRAHGEEREPEVQERAPSRRGRQQTKPDETPEHQGHEPQLRDVIGRDLVHADVVVQPVDAVQIVGLHSGDLVDPDPEPESLGVLWRVQIDAPQGQHVDREQGERCHGHDDPG